MHLPSLLGHTQELLGMIRGSAKPADSLIDTFFRARKYLGSTDRRFIAETTYGTLRHLRKATALMEQAVGGEELLPDDLLLLQIVSYAKGIARDTTITPAALLPRLKGSRIKEKLDDVFRALETTDLVLPDDPEQRIALRHSFPDWMVARFVREFGLEETEQFCASLNEPAPITLRVNALQTDREICRHTLETEGVIADPAGLAPTGLHLRKRTNVFALESFRKGWFEVQDEGSQLLPFMLDPKPTDKVLDACAGAGGKSLAFSALMKGRGEIMAADVNRFRLEELRKRAKRAGAQNIRVRPVDGVEDLEGEFAGFFDLVLVDAPCSGLGTIRRNPGMKWMVTEETVGEVAARQQQILGQAARLVKPGGRLAYATCTVLRQENEDVVGRFLQEDPGFTPVAPRVVPDGVVVRDSAVRLYPHQHGTDGFFLAVLQRRQR